MEQLQQKDVLLTVKNLDDDSTLEFNPEISNKYTEIRLKKNVKYDIWSDFWNQVRNLEDEMWEAIYTKDLQKLKEIFEMKGEIPLQIDCQSLDKWTALHYSCFEGDLNIVNFLIEKGANIQAKTSINRTALHLAVIRENVQIVNYLLSKNANINSQDDDLCTPLHYASVYGFQEILKLMFQYKQKIDFSLKNNRNMTAGQAALNGKIFKYFYNHQNQNNQYSRTMIDQVIRKTSRADYVQKLLNMTQQIKNRESRIVDSKKSNLNSNANFQNNTKLQKKVSKFQKINTNVQKILIQDIEHQEGKNIGPNSFEIIDILGKGSFGEVYLVKKKDSKVYYAMKVLQKQRVKLQNLTSYVLSERNILTLMDNPFIVKIYYAFQTKQKLFLILEYCPGGDLERRVTAEKSFSEQVTKIYAAQITIAIQSLHKRQIIFRDLKPANIVLDPQGHAKVTDFGLCKQSKTSKSFCGSVAYLAPQMLFKKRHGFTLDWYLLGVLIYQLLIGMPPYYCSNPDRMFENIKYMKLSYPKHFSEDCKNLLTRLLQRDPSKRLGAKTDAKQIKEHPWFKDINWQDAYNRKLIPPKIIPKKINQKKIDFFAGTEPLPEQKLNGWSFFQS